MFIIIKMLITNLHCWLRYVIIIFFIKNIFVLFKKPSYFTNNILYNQITKFLNQNNINEEQIINDNLRIITKIFNLLYNNLILQNFFISSNENIVIFNQVIKYNNCINLPLFQLYIIDFLKQLGFSVLDLLFLEDNKIYLHWSKYYTYENIPFSTVEILKSFNNKNTYNSILAYLKATFDKNDILIVSHYEHNETLREYFKRVINLTTIHNTTYKLFEATNMYNTLNYNFTTILINKRLYVLTACLFNHENKQNLGFIQDNNQYIIKENIINVEKWLDNIDSYNNKIFIYVLANNTCTNIDVIPQYIRDTCWFNAILMATLYSENSRNKLLEISKNWDRTDKILNIFRIILKNNKNPEKSIIIKKLFKKIKPEQIIIKITSSYKNDFKESKSKTFKKTYNYTFEWNTEYIINFLKDILKVKVLDILYDAETDKCILNFNKIIDDTICKNTICNNSTSHELPDYIVLYHSSIFKKYKKMYKFIIDNITNYETIEKTKYSGIENYEEQISFNGHDYKLDSCLLSDKLIFNNWHVIAGITCNNNKYVYNGWYNPIINSPCSLMSYDWDLHKKQKFCLNPILCKLNLTKNKGLVCFSFNQGERVLVYVRIDKPNINTQSNISSVLNISSLSLSNDLNKFFDLDNYTNEDLISHLEKNKLVTTNLKNKTREELINLMTKKLKKTVM